MNHKFGTQSCNVDKVANQKVGKKKKNHVKKVQGGLEIGLFFVVSKQIHEG